MVPARHRGRGTMEVVAAGSRGSARAAVTVNECPFQRFLPQLVFLGQEISLCVSLLLSRSLSPSLSLSLSLSLSGSLSPSPSLWKLNWSYYCGGQCYFTKTDS